MSRPRRSTTHLRICRICTPGVFQMSTRYQQWSYSMRLTRFFGRSFHQVCRFLDQNKGLKKKSAKDVIKLIASSDRPNIKDDIDKRNVPTWQKQQLALKKKFGGERWNPMRRLSREEMESLRLLKNQFPKLTASDLADRFKVSPEAVRRVLKSSWHPSAEESARLQERWKRRGERIKEMYDQSQGMLPNSDKIVVKRKISISSGRTSADFVLRNVRTKNPAKEATSGKSSPVARSKTKEKSKLYLLKNSMKNR